MTTTEPNEKVLSRVRKLLEMAEGFARMAERAETEKDRAHHEAERVATMERAMTMMSTYGIERAMLANSGEVDDSVDKAYIVMTDPYSYEKSALLCAIAGALGCKPLRYTLGKKVTRVAIVGHASNRERVELLYTSLLIQMISGAAHVEAGYRYFESVAQRGQHTRRLRSSFMFGFADEIGNRLEAAETYAARQNAAANPEREAAGVSTELVLVDRQALVNQKFAEFFPKTTKLGARTYLVSGYQAGQAAGQRADLGTTRFGSNGTAALSGGQR